MNMKKDKVFEEGGKWFYRIFHKHPSDIYGAVHGPYDDEEFCLVLYLTHCRAISKKPTKSLLSRAQALTTSAASA
jgi:hypothetical protein